MSNSNQKPDSGHTADKGAELPSLQNAVAVEVVEEVEIVRSTYYKRRGDKTVSVKSMAPTRDSSSTTMKGAASPTERILKTPDSAATLGSCDSQSPQTAATHGGSVAPKERQSKPQSSEKAKNGVKKKATLKTEIAESLDGYKSRIRHDPSEELRREVENLNRTNCNLQKEKKDIEEKLISVEKLAEDTSNELKNKQAKISELTSKIVQLENQLQYQAERLRDATYAKSFDPKDSAVRSEGHMLKDSSEELRHEVESLKQAYNKLESEKRDIEKKLNCIQKFADENSYELSIKQAEVSQMAAKISELQNELRREKEKMKDASGANVLESKDSKRLTEPPEELRREVENLKQTNSQMEEEKKDVEQQLSITQKLADDNSNELNIKKTLISELKSKIGELQNELQCEKDSTKDICGGKSLETKDFRMVSEARLLIDSCEELRREVENLKQTIVILELEKKDIEKKLDNLQKFADENSYELSIKQEEVSQMAAKISELQNELHREKERMKDASVTNILESKDSVGGSERCMPTDPPEELRREVENLKQANSQMEKEKKDVEQELSKIQKLADDNANELNIKQALISELKSKIGELQNELQCERKRFKDISVPKSLESKDSAVGSGNRVLKDLCEELRCEAETLKQANNKLEKENRNLEGTLIGFRKRIDHCSNELNIKEATISELTSKIRKLEQELGGQKEGMKGAPCTKSLESADSVVASESHMLKDLRHKSERKDSENELTNLQKRSNDSNELIISGSLSNAVGAEKDLQCDERKCCCKKKIDDLEAELRRYKRTVKRISGLLDEWEMAYGIEVNKLPESYSESAKAAHGTIPQPEKVIDPKILPKRLKYILDACMETIVEIYSMTSRAKFHDEKEVQTDVVPHEEKCVQTDTADGVFVAGGSDKGAMQQQDFEEMKRNCEKLSAVLMKVKKEKEELYEEVNRVKMTNQKGLCRSCAEAEQRNANFIPTKIDESKRVSDSSIGQDQKFVVAENADAENFIPIVDRTERHVRTPPDEFGSPSAVRFMHHNPVCDSGYDAGYNAGRRDTIIKWQKEKEKLLQELNAVKMRLHYFDANRTVVPSSNRSTPCCSTKAEPNNDSCDTEFEIKSFGGKYFDESGPTGKMDMKESVQKSEDDARERDMLGGLMVSRKGMDSADAFWVLKEPFVDRFKWILCNWAKALNGATKLFTFKYSTDSVHKVYLCGSFYNWELAVLMNRKTECLWEMSVDLPLGRHEFRFICEQGNWATSNDYGICPNDFGTTNNYIIIN